jgi:hypothetical protein
MSLDSKKNEEKKEYANVVATTINKYNKNTTSTSTKNASINFSQTVLLRSPYMKTNKYFNNIKLNTSSNVERNDSWFKKVLDDMPASFCFEEIFIPFDVAFQSNCWKARIQKDFLNNMLCASYLMQLKIIANKSKTENESFRNSMILAINHYVETKIVHKTLGIDKDNIDAIFSTIKTNTNYESLKYIDEQLDLVKTKYMHYVSLANMPFNENDPTDTTSNKKFDIEYVLNCLDNFLFGDNKGSELFQGTIKPTYSLHTFVHAFNVLDEMVCSLIDIDKSKMFVINTNKWSHVVYIYKDTVVEELKTLFMSHEELDELDELEKDQLKVLQSNVLSSKTRKNNNVFVPELSTNSQSKGKLIVGGTTNYLQSAGRSKHHGKIVFKGAKQQYNIYTDMNKKRYIKKGGSIIYLNSIKGQYLKCCKNETKI